MKLNERTLFVVVGDRAREQVVNLHYMLSKAVVKSRPNVLWCYKKELYLSSHKKKRVKQIKKMVSRGLMDPENEDPFSLFVASTDIKYTYYADTQKILGNTYGMAVLQDFEALTPNLLARTVETVEGGGIVVLLLSNLESLSQLYTLTMDVHARFRTESHQHVTARFNERFILSLGHCPTCIMMDDELNILPISSHVRDIQPVGGEIAGAADPEDLADLKRSLQETEPAGPLVSCCKTLDQAKAVVTFLDAASEKTLRSTVALTAARGRGKSAAMGIAVAGAIGMGYANVFVTSPSPENLNTFFQFVLKGFDALGYKEHLDYDLVESSNPAFGKAIVRVNVTRAHRQTIQYILPQHAERATQAELLVIDEAAAIPLPTVQKLLGPYLVFLCSTVNGYEGTGRALSLKLISNLRRDAAGAAAGGGGGAAQTGRLLREVQLAEPVRYSFGDRVEGWLNGLLCLDAADATPPLTGALPPRRVRLVRGEPRHALLRAPRVGALSEAHDVAVRRQPLQKHAQRPAAHGGRARAQAVRAARAGGRDCQRAARDSLRPAGGAGGGHLPGQRQRRSPRATRRRATSSRGLSRRSSRIRTSPCSRARASCASPRTRTCPRRATAPGRCSSCTRTTKANSWTCSRRSPTRADPTPGRTARGRRRRRPSRTAVCSGRPSSRARRSRRCSRRSARSGQRSATGSPRRSG